MQNVPKKGMCGKKRGGSNRAGFVISGCELAGFVSVYNAQQFA